PSDKFFERARAPRNPLRIKDIGRFVDEVTGEHHTACHCLAGTKGFTRSISIGDADRDLRRRWLLFALARLGLVAVEGIGPQPYTEAKVCHLIGLHWAARQFGDEGGISRTGNAAHRDPTKLEKVLRLQLIHLATTT